MTGVENTIPEAVIIIFLNGFGLSGSISTIATQHSVDFLTLLLFMQPLLMSHERRCNHCRLDSWLCSGLVGRLSGRLKDRLTLWSGLLGWLCLFLELLLVVHVVFQCLY